MWFIIGHVFVTVSNYPTFIFSPSKLEADSGGVFFKKQTTVTVLQTTSLLCSLSFWRLAVHYCHLMSSKSITSLHSVFFFFTVRAQLRCFACCTTFDLCVQLGLFGLFFFFSRKNEFKSRERDCGNSFFPPFNWFFLLFFTSAYRSCHISFTCHVKLSKGQATLMQLSSPSPAITYLSLPRIPLMALQIHFHPQCVACNMLSHCHYNMARDQVWITHVSMGLLLPIGSITV